MKLTQLKKFGFTYLMGQYDKQERIVEIEAIDEESANKKYLKFLKKHGLLKGEELGELIENKTKIEE